MRTTPLRRFGQEPSTVATDPYLLFRVHGATYAMPLLAVREVMDLIRLAPVTEAPEALRGTQVLRGHRIPVVDLGAVLEQRPLRLTRTSCTLVIRNDVVHGQSGQRGTVEGDSAADGPLIGLAVDAVSGVKELAAADLMAPPRLGETAAMNVVSAMARIPQGLVPVLDPIRTLASTDVRLAVAAWDAAEAVDPQPVA